jgi:hypothetical protein
MEKNDSKTLEALFNEVINTRGIHHQLGMKEATVRSLRKQYNDKGSISVEKMREILKIMGYRSVQSEMWG